MRTDLISINEQVIALSNNECFFNSDKRDQFPQTEDEANDLINSKKAKRRTINLEKSDYNVLENNKLMAGALSELTEFSKDIKASNSIRFFLC